MSGQNDERTPQEKLPCYDIFVTEIKNAINDAVERENWHAVMKGGCVLSNLESFLSRVP